MCEKFSWPLLHKLVIDCLELKIRGQDASFERYYEINHLDFLKDIEIFEYHNVDIS